VQTLRASIIRFFGKIPTEVKNFVVKGCLILVGWCLLYGLVFKHYHLLDPQLTSFTGETIIRILHFLYSNQHPGIIYTDLGAKISLNDREVLYLGDACNGLDLYVLFTGFIMCVPMDVKKMTRYVVVGILCIFVLNIVRCLALIYLYDHQSSYTDIAHHYIFQLIVYAAIFMVWERYFRSVKISHETTQV
jgi:exosortase/archaeosortase family protein